MKKKELNKVKSKYDKSNKSVCIVLEKIFCKKHQESKQCADFYWILTSTAMAEPLSK